jgi:hypothetical protein
VRAGSSRNEGLRESGSNTSNGGPGSSAWAVSGRRWTRDRRGVDVVCFVGEASKAGDAQEELDKRWCPKKQTGSAVQNADAEATDAAIGEVAA